MSEDVQTKTTRELLFLAGNIARCFAGATADERFRYMSDGAKIDAEADRRDAEMAAAKQLLGETTLALRDVIGYAEAYCRGVSAYVDDAARARHEIHIRKARAALGIMAPKPADDSI